MRDEDDRVRRLREQREMVHGSGAPRTLPRWLPGPMPRRPSPPARRWREVGTGERIAWVASYLAALGLLALFGLVAWAAAGAVGVVSLAGLLMLCWVAILALRRAAPEDDAR